MQSSCSSAGPHRKRLAIWRMESSTELLHSLKTLLVGVLVRCAFVPLCSMWQLGIMGKEGGDVRGFHSPLLPICCAILVVS